MSPMVSHLALLAQTAPAATDADAPATGTIDTTSVAMGVDTVAAPASSTSMPASSAPATSASGAGNGTATPVATRGNGSPQPGHGATATAQVGVPAPMPHAPSSAGSIGGALFALVLVVGLILLLGWLAKRMPGLGGTRNNAALRVVGSLALGPRDRVVVVAVGDTQLLLGVGSGGTRTLHTLAEPLPVAPESKATPAFAQLLAQHFGKKP